MCSEEGCTYKTVYMRQCQWNWEGATGMHTKFLRAESKQIVTVGFGFWDSFHHRSHWVELISVVVQLKYLVLEWKCIAYVLSDIEEMHKF